jgi:hypothetical protein
MIRGVVYLVALVALVAGGCATQPTPQQRFDSRVREFGRPDWVDAPTSGGQRQMMRPEYARKDIADSPEQIFYYLDRDEQVAFRPGQPPARGPINPMARRSFAELAAAEQHIKKITPQIIREGRRLREQQNR